MDEAQHADSGNARTRTEAQDESNAKQEMGVKTPYVRQF